MTPIAEDKLFENIANPLFEIKSREKESREYLQRKIKGELDKIPSNLFLRKIVRLGTYKSASEIRDVMKKGGLKISNWGNDILNRILFREEGEVTLVIATVAELGFTSGARYRDIVGRIQELGFDLCPAEVGPQLRLQYLDQKQGEWLVIAMNPVPASDGHLSMFNVTCDDDGKWLFGDYGDPDHFWLPRCRLVFMNRRKQDFK